MTGDELVALLDAALQRLAESKEELRDLDAALGDGDLGITVSKGCEAVRERLAGMSGAPPADVIRAAGTAFATANPSTMAALVGGALLAAAKAVSDRGDLNHDDALRLARAAAESVAARGKAEIGDKTMLDAIVPSVDVLAAAQGELPLPGMVEAAGRAVAETTPLQSKRGRAAWVGERSIGHADPGATAYLRLLEALQHSWPVPTQS